MNLRVFIIYKERGVPLILILMHSRILDVELDHKLNFPHKSDETLEVPLRLFIIPLFTQKRGSKTLRHFSCTLSRASVLY